MKEKLKHPGLPPMPPCRTISAVYGIETEESKQRTKDWYKQIDKWKEDLENYRNQG